METMLVVDGDRTLAVEDRRKSFWLMICDSERDGRK
jgi:hypothetical protein